MTGKSRKAWGVRWWKHGTFGGLLTLLGCATPYSYEPITRVEGVDSPVRRALAVRRVSAAKPAGGAAGDREDPRPGKGQPAAAEASAMGTEKDKPDPAVRRARHQEDSLPPPKEAQEGEGPLLPAKKAEGGPATEAKSSDNELPPVGAPGKDRYPIDLVTALNLGGANNLQIALAQERVREAQAVLQGAEALWIPSINAGVGYNRHTGQIQDTRGEVLEVSRNSLFVGGGANTSNAPLTGGAGNPRLFVGLPLTDALFAPLAQRQFTRAAAADRAATFNDTLLQIGLTYLDLQDAQSRVAIAAVAVANAERLVGILDSQVRAKVALPADLLRARAEQADRRQQLTVAREDVRVVSAELVRLLRLDPALALFPVDARPVPVKLVDVETPLPDLLAQGVASRPELSRDQALVRATLEQLRQEHWRPFLPAVQVGLSAGGFGGGESAFLGNFDGRSDFDALLVWELRNLGFGNRALRREQASRHRQAHLSTEQTRDLILAEVAASYHQVRQRRQRMEETREQVEAAAEALPLNFRGVLGGTLRAIEAQQAIQALASAQTQYLRAILDYNRAQFQLLRAIGRPLEEASCTP